MLRLVYVVAMNVAVKDGHVLEWREHVEHGVAVAREPFPVRPQIEERTMREDDDRRRVRITGDVARQPRQLLRADFRLAARHVVERDEMHAAVIERVVRLAEEVT